MTKMNARRPTNVSLPDHLVAEAKALGINLSRACESGVAAALQAERDRQWKVANKDAIDAYNRWVAEHGLPLDEFRQF
jgi:antitoxin CcdA